MFSSLRETRSFRWFLCLWLGLLGTTAIMTIHGKHASASPRAIPTFVWIGLFLILMTAQLALYQWSFTHHTGQRARFVYVSLQCALILIISLLYANSILDFGLYLALNVEAITLLKRGAYLVLAGFSLLAAIILPALYLETWRGTFDYTAVILFVAGCFLLYLQQVQAHLRDRTLLHELAVAHRRLEDYAQQVEDLTRASERQRIARELHDTLAQDLAGLIMQLEAIHTHLRLQHAERAEMIVLQAKERARAALGAARGAIDELRAREREEGDLAERVAGLIARFTASTGISCEADLDALTAVGATASMQVIQIIAEGLANIERHAHTRRAWVHARLNDTSIDIEVGDDGIGFDVAAVTQQAGHYGIVGMRERARLIGGSLDLMSHSQMGTVLRLCLPLQALPGARIDGHCDTVSSR